MYISVTPLITIQVYTRMNKPKADKYRGQTFLVWGYFSVEGAYNTIRGPVKIESLCDNYS